MASTDDVSRKREKLERCPPGHDGRYVALYNLACALYKRFKKERKIDDLNEATTLNRDALELRSIEDEESDRSGSLQNLALCLYCRYHELGAVDDLEEAIRLGRKALALCPPGHPARDMCLHNLATVRKQTEICDLEEKIQLYREALELRPLGHPFRYLTLYELIRCLSHRYEKQGSLKDLEEVVTLRRAELDLRPRGHPHHDIYLHSLACDLRRRFAKTAAISDLEESIDLHRAVLELRRLGHVDRSSTLHELTLCLSYRHDKYGVADDLEEAITLGREALQLCPSGHPDRGEFLHNLACSLRKRSVKQAATHDLEEAIELHRVVSELRPSGHPQQASTLHELALCLSNRYDKLGVIDNLEEAITVGRAALELCPLGHPDHGMSLQCLARDLRKRFAKNATTRDLEESIELLRPALELRPMGHPDRSSSLHELARCLSHRHDKHGVTDGLKEAILLGREALELCPPGHPDRGVILHSLACDLWKKFQYLHQAAAVVRPTSRAGLAAALFEFSQHLWDQFQRDVIMTDLDNAICLATYALELRLPPEDVSVAAWVERVAKGSNSDEPGRAVDNLRALANYHRARFRAQHAIIDLNEAITFYRHTLRFRPVGHPNRASSLHDLAQCLADRFREQPAAADVNLAIVLEQEALHLFVRGVPGYHVSRRCLAAYLQMEFNSRVAMKSSGGSNVTPLDVKRVIRNVAFETLKTMPPRLLYTPTGFLYNRDEQITHFMDSQQCEQLESLCATCDRHQQMELIHADISRHFQYVTLSHRWGEDEPSLCDIEDCSLYGPFIDGGFGKLQAFCRVALEWDYLWAWSDTSAESALTIVHLSDVPDTASFGSSEWFGRGSLLFYTENWSLYKNPASSNHKMDVAVLAELERETGIDRRFFTSFSPGWASLRRTTRPEDIAYSLFGIFNVHLPNALGRLLAEIVSQSGDISVLDWVGKPSPFHSCFPAHITSYQMLRLPTSQHNAEEQSSAINQQPTLFKVLRKLRGSLATSHVLHFLGRSLTSSSIVHRVSPVRLRTPVSYASSEVVPLARFFNRLLTLPWADPSTPSYMYNIVASGLMPLEIALPTKLEDVTRPQAVLHLLLGPSVELDAVTEQQLLSALWTPFNALLIASSTLITVQPIDRASVLNSKIRVFNVV
ncbi:hypothetical protein BKA83DRAFT_4251007 [Pisolithus microcarpus]|nr:hypothetical protein BKA83DRAFT_4251007 [Pisolithus microcarpus]